MPFTVDLSEAAGFSGFMQELSVQIGTPLHIGPVLKFAHGKMSDEFTAYMSAIAPLYPSEFHHVYEWGEIGSPDGQLWRDVLRGNGAVRTATWEWLASKKTVPVIPEAAAVGVQQVHVFAWKAPVMEYMTDITITPQEGHGLAFFTGPQNTNQWPLKFTRQAITVQFPGGAPAHMAFTKEYIAWWGGEAGQKAFERSVMPILEKDLAEIGPALTVGTRSRQKVLGVQTASNWKAAYAQGQAEARRFLDGRDRKYIDQANARRTIMGLGGVND